MNSLLEERKHEFREARSHGELTNEMRHWHVNDEDILEDAHLSRSFTTHRKQGTSMSLTEYVHSMNLVYSYCDTEKERFEEMLNANTLLFCDTAETEANGFQPFSKPLGELWKEMKKDIAKRSYDAGIETGKLMAKSEDVKE